MSLRDDAEQAYWDGLDDDARLYEKEIEVTESDLTGYLGDAIYQVRRAILKLNHLTGHLAVPDYAEGLGGHDMVVHLQDAGRSLRAAQAIHHDLRQDLKKERQAMR
jgi:hypothetical protein